MAFDAAGYTLELSDNLFVPLSPASRAEFGAGDGSEVGAAGRPGKMQALHSSSALACNVFAYWRDRDASPLAAALGLAGSIRSLIFEHKLPTGLPGNPPNLDVVLTLQDDSIVAVESKFLEPYGAPPAAGFAAGYFDPAGGQWTARGFAHCQALAAHLQSGELRLRWLDAGQLLKHILGLAASGSAWALCYLWYGVGGPAGAEHAAEADKFARIVARDGIAFRAMSYQVLFRRLKASCGESDAPYLRYLAERYFGESD